MVSASGYLPVPRMRREGKVRSAMRERLDREAGSDVDGHLDPSAGNDPTGTQYCVPRIGRDS